MLTFILLSLIKVIVAWVILSFIGTNLISVTARWFLVKSLIADNAYPSYLKERISKSNLSSRNITILAFLTMTGFLFYLFYFWGILFVVATIFLMATRLIDLHWEVCVLPKEFEMAYPIPKVVAQKAMKRKNRNTTLWEALLHGLLQIGTWVALFIAIYSQG